MSSDTKSELEVSVRLMTERDISSVMKIEREAFSDPWSASAFEQQLREAGWGAIVAETDGKVIGYACYYILDAESHLTNIAVASDYQRKSVAKRLLENILRVVTDQRCEFLLLEVRPSNTPAVAFYERYGFKLLYRRPHYYRKPLEDALVMVRYLEDDEKA